MNALNISGVPEYDEISEYPIDGHRQLRVKLLLACDTILYSNDERLKAKAYDDIFSIWKSRIIYRTHDTLVSTLDEVFIKILLEANNSDDGIDKTTGQQYPNAVKLIAMIRDQEAATYAKRLVDKSLRLKQYLLYFMMDEKTKKIYNPWLKSLLQLYFKDL